MDVLEAERGGYRAEEYRGEESVGRQGRRFAQGGGEGEGGVGGGVGGGGLARRDGWRMRWVGLQVPRGSVNDVR